MEPRTEEDKLLQVGISVMLGGVTYQVRPLVIKEARLWRRQAATLIKRFPGLMGLTTDDPKAFEAGLETLVAEIPDQIADLFFAYVKDLPREQIESEASEVELATAFAAVMEVGFPLLRGLTESMGKMVR